MSAAAPVRRLPMLPKTRADCIDGQRPCPWDRCRHHLQPAPPWPRERELRPTTGDSCALDCADRGAMTLEEIGRAMGRTRERIRQVEAKALENLARELDRRGLLAAGAAEALKQVHRVATELRT